MQEPCFLGERISGKEDEESRQLRLVRLGRIELGLRGGTGREAVKMGGLGNKAARHRHWGSRARDSDGAGRALECAIKQTCSV